MKYAIPNWNLDSFHKLIRKFEKKGLTPMVEKVEETLIRVEDKDYLCTVYNIENEKLFSAVEKLDVDAAIENLPTYANKWIGYNTKDIIALCINEIKENGFKSSSEGEESTKARVTQLYSSNSCPEIVAKLINTNIVDEYLEWANERESDSDFDWKAKTASKSNYCQAFSIGYIAAYIKTFLKELEKKATANMPLHYDVDGFHLEHNNSYAAPIGERLDVEIVASKVVHVNEPYAYSAPLTKIYKLIDSEGHVIIWTTSQDVPSHCRLVGKVKAHKEYKGIFETIITRGTIYAY